MTTLLISSTIENFGAAMYLMLQGMAGIFIFMILFYLLIFGLEKIFQEKKE
ncbi:MAG TPA: OadG-related small transporter subunit [Candidatus Cloacimonadota bacterium]|nr:OadG-related small transporter subunit [Candidatus Cloacimonadota bacterium]HPS37853.1 OadG-related small transporter subunit [Candidatus Cloacimonadota bacterium]